MGAFDLEQVCAARAASAEPWLEFLRAPSLSMGVYHLKAGQADRQQPHTEDEVYYIVSGRGMFRAASEARPVQAGTILFVARLVEHHFFDIAEDLTALVFFAPPEGTLHDQPRPAQS